MAKKKDEALRRVALSILDDIPFFEDVDNPGKFYAEIPNGNHKEIYGINAQKFRAFLRIEFRKRCNTTENYDFNDVLVKKTDEITWTQEPKQVHTRLAATAKAFVYFLADKDWKSVIISESGWRVYNSKKIKFVKNGINKEQVMPDTVGGDLQQLLKPFINMKPQSFKLFLIYLVQCFFPKSSHFLAVISSERGSGKSTLTKLIQEIIDPSETTNTILPTTPDNVLNLFANNIVVALDNTQKLPDNISDIFCTSVTGGTYTKRKLYTDNEQVLVKLKNVIILNGIDILPDKGDLRERSVLFELEGIPSHKRRTEAEIWKDFNAVKPQIMGAIFDTVSKAMKIKNTLKLEKTHRMSDAYTDMAAIAMALGFSLEEFEETFEENRRRIDELHCNTNALCDIIDDYMERRRYKPVSGRVSEVYEDIYHSMPQKDSALPKSPSSFSRKMRKEQENLRKRGYRVTFPDPDRKGSYIKIERNTK